jgi:hypothetical protein
MLNAFDESQTIFKSKFVLVKCIRIGENPSTGRFCGWRGDNGHMKASHSTTEDAPMADDAGRTSRGIQSIEVGARWR